MSEEQIHEMFGQQDPFSDFFRTFFGGGGGAPRPGRGARRRAAGRDIEHEIELSLTEALHGVTRRIAIEHDGHRRTVDVRIPVGVRTGVPCARGGRGGAGPGRRRGGRSVSQDAAAPAAWLRTQGAGSARSGADPGHDGRPRRRGSGEDARGPLPPSEDSGHDAAGTGPAFCVARACRRSASRTSAGTCLPPSRSRCRGG